MKAACRSGRQRSSLVDRPVYPRLRRTLSVAEASIKSAKFADLNVPVSGLYLLAAQRPEVQEAVLEAVEFSAS